VRIAATDVGHVFARHPPLRLLAGGLALGGWGLLFASVFLPAPWPAVALAGVPVCGAGAVLAGHAGPRDPGGAGVGAETPASVRLSLILLVVYAAGFVAMLGAWLFGILPDLLT
jgi:hypothetical protein